MRVLHVNKFAFSKGGAEEYMLRLAKEQRRRGDDVWIFGSTDGREVGVDERTIDYRVIDFHSARGPEKVRAVEEVMWSRRAQRALADTMSEVRPDIVHLHNYAHQLSSAILPAISARGVRSVYTAHDYKLICPAYVANRGGTDCFKCADRISPTLLVDRCHHGSAPWSAIVAAEALLVRAKRMLPDAVIAPSQFMFEQLRSSWMGAQDITLVRNPAVSGGINWQGGGPLLYVGRLSREKGLRELVLAASELGWPLNIAGEGPLRSELEESADPRLVRFLGHISQEELAVLREGCRAQVVPSQWPENAPLSVLESVVDGVPVIATRRGGLPEFQELGARIALIDDVSANAFRHAVQVLDAVRPDLGELRDVLSWDRHLAAVDATYGGR